MCFSTSEFPLKSAVSVADTKVSIKTSLIRDGALTRCCTLQISFGIDPPFFSPPSWQDQLCPFPQQLLSPSDFQRIANILPDT
jgi:hypothetical protein